MSKTIQIKDYKLRVYKENGWYKLEIKKRYGWVKVWMASELEYSSMLENLRGLSTGKYIIKGGSFPELLEVDDIRKEIEIEGLEEEYFNL